MSLVSSMREKILQLWKNKEIRDKLWFTLMVIVVFRIMAAVPVPGVPLDALKQFFGGSSFGQVLSLVSGGVLENATLVAIGLGPYINASVIFQLLGSVVPKIEELQKEGAQGRKVINMYTRLLTVPLAIMQSLVIYSILQQYGIMSKLEPLALVNMVATLTAGAVIMMWMGELISEHGFGGGSSLLIFAGIMAGIPGSLKTNVGSLTSADLVTLGGSYLLIIMLVVFITQAERLIPVQYARRVRAAGPTVGSNLPIKINQSGVMPVIFAMSFLSFPQLIAQFLTGASIPDSIKNGASWLVTQLGNPVTYNALLFIFIVMFSLFYTFVVFNPGRVAENLQKQAAFIPGVRPGAQTVKYLTVTAGRLAILGSLFLAGIALVPNVAKELGILSQTVFSGTGLLIAVGVILDVRRQIESMIVTQSYESYL
jgi:preprotein translocase subunit SecY